MPKFEVKLEREQSVTYAATVEITAATHAEAEREALKLAFSGDVDWDEFDAETREIQAVDCHLLQPQSKRKAGR